MLKTIDTGPITNHVNFVRNANGTFAYVTIGGLNEVKVFRTDDFSQVATIPVGKLPHGIWPSGDGTRVYVGLENADALAAIDTLTNKVIATMPDRPGAAGHRLCAERGARRRRHAGPAAARRRRAGRASRAGASARQAQARRSADQRLAVRSGADRRCCRRRSPGLQPKQPYVLALADEPDGKGALEPLAAFMTNPAGSAIVNAVGPIRQIVKGEDHVTRRYLVIVSGTPDKPGTVVQAQLP